MPIFSGIFKPRYSNLADARNPEQADGEAGTALLGNLVQELAGVRFTVDSEKAQSPANGPDTDFEALATPPLELNLKLGEDYQTGQRLFAQGPHGPIEVEAPPDAQPGKVLTYRLGPPPDLRITVPQGLKGGQTMQF